MVVTHVMYVKVSRHVQFKFYYLFECMNSEVDPYPSKIKKCLFFWKTPHGTNL
jgi:hypothetical protein